MFVIVMYGVLMTCRSIETAAAAAGCCIGMRTEERIISANPLILSISRQMTSA